MIVGGFSTCPDAEPEALQRQPSAPEILAHRGAFSGQAFHPRGYVDSNAGAHLLGLLRSGDNGGTGTGVEVGSAPPQHAQQQEQVRPCPSTCLASPDLAAGNIAINTFMIFKQYKELDVLRCHFLGHAATDASRRPGCGPYRVQLMESTSGWRSGSSIHSSCP